MSRRLDHAARPRLATLLAVLLAAGLGVGWAPVGAFAQHRPLAAAALRGTGPVVVVMSGTFDPVHDGHLAVMRAARDYYRAQGRTVRVIAVPNPTNPLKTPIPVADRLEILRRSLADTDHADITVPDAREWRSVERGGAHGLVHSLVRSVPPGTQVVRVYGADSFEASREHGVVDELRRAGVEVLVAERPGYSLPSALPPGVTRLPVAGGTSSTAIRAALAGGTRPTGVRAPALLYIRQRGLYGAPRSTSTSTITPRPSVPAGRTGR